MPNTAPGAERLAGGVSQDAAPAAPPRPAVRAWRRAGVAVFLLLGVALCYAYLRLSMTYPENSDEANILLMADDMLHGNVTLAGWNVSDVPFITTELPQIAVLVALFGLHLNTAHIAAAMTYTLVVAVAMLLAKGKTRGWAAAARMALVLGIMIAPQPGVGVFVAIFSVGHIGTALPVMLTWLVIDRLGRRWYVPLIVAVMLAWALMADPLVLVIAIFPMLAVCLVRLVSAVTCGARDGGWDGVRQAVAGRWPELSLAAAAGASYLIVLLGRLLLAAVGAYHQQPVPFAIDAAGTWFWHTRVVVHGLLEMFGAYFVPGQDPQYGLGTLDQLIAISHLAGVVLAVWGACAIARRMFFRDADFISQLLLAGIVANIAAYVPSTLAAHTALNTREIAPVLPFAAVLAGRMLGDRLVTGPLAALRLPRFRLGRRLAAAVPLAVLSGVALLGWYGFGLIRQAAAPAAPPPLAQLAAYLESEHLTYGLSGYWQASVLTVETGGAVTVRAVRSECLQPYEWESKGDWYDPKLHSANFLLISNLPGYFTLFTPSTGVLKLLDTWSNGQVVHHDFDKAGKPLTDQGKSAPISARVYPMDLLTRLPAIVNTLDKPPAFACS